MSLFESHTDLILSLAKFTSALLIAFAVAPFLKRPALRAAFWTAVFIILPTGIFITHGRSILNILPQLSAAPVQLAVPPSEAVTPSADDSEMPQIALQAPPRQNNWVAIVFFTGLGVSLFPILISVLQLRFIPKKPAGVFAVDAWAKIRLQEAKAVPLYLTSCRAAPFTAGLIREAVLLPEASTDWSLRRLRSTLYHEAAHISRKDPLVRMFASLVRAIFWFHPLIWLAHRRLVAAQEEACDEIALAGGIPADEYAEDLLQTAKDCQNPFGHCLNMAQWSQLGHRVRIILQNEKTKNHPLTMKSIAIVSIGIAATTFGLSTLGYSEAPKAVEQAPEQAQKPAEPGKLEEKLKRIIIPRTDFENTTLEEAVKFLRLRCVELDTTELDPAKKGVNFTIRRMGGAADPSTLRIKELRLRNVPVAVAIKYICEQTQTTYKVDDRAVIFVIEKKAD
jgi:beta-lactamase regulating signal transducer with metallopeptidase domain